MKLQQGQVWKSGDEYIRIVHLERLVVGYKSLPSLNSTEGTHLHTSKKDFCRLLKGARLLADKPPSKLAGAKLKTVGSKPAKSKGEVSPDAKG